MSSKYSKRNVRRASPRRRSSAVNLNGPEGGYSEESGCAQESLLEQINQGTALCKEIEAQLAQNPAPELETIIKLYRVLLLKLSAEVRDTAEVRQLVSALIRPVMEWARLEEKRKDRELAELKYRDATAARKAAREAAQSGRDSALRPETLQKIESELKLV